MHSIKELRLKTNMTQKAFAEKYKIPLSTLRKWEQGESRTPHYVIYFIEHILPMDNDDYEKFVGKNNNLYYLDRDNKKVCDSKGNWISFNEDINGVITDNIVLYIENLFENYYKLVEKFDSDLHYDKIDKIIWR